MNAFICGKETRKGDSRIRVAHPDKLCSGTAALRATSPDPDLCLHVLALPGRHPALFVAFHDLEQDIRTRHERDNTQWDSQQKTREAQTGGPTAGCSRSPDESVDIFGIFTIDYYIVSNFAPR